MNYGYQVQETMESTVTQSYGYLNLAEDQALLVGIIPDGLQSTERLLFMGCMLSGEYQVITSPLVQEALDAKVLAKPPAFIKSIILSQVLMILALTLSTAVDRLGIDPRKLDLDYLIKLLLVYSPNHPISRMLREQNAIVKLNINKLRGEQIAIEIVDNMKKGKLSGKIFTVDDQNLHPGAILYRQLRNLSNVVQEMSTIRGKVKDFIRLMGMPSINRSISVVAIVMAYFPVDLPANYKGQIPGFFIDLLRFAKAAKQLVSRNLYASFLKCLVQFRELLIKQLANRRKDVQQNKQNQIDHLKRIKNDQVLYKESLFRFFLTEKESHVFVENDFSEAFQRHAQRLKENYKLEQERDLNAQERKTGLEGITARNAHMQTVLDALQLDGALDYATVPIGMGDDFEQEHTIQSNHEIGMEIEEEHNDEQAQQMEIEEGEKNEEEEEIKSKKQQDDHGEHKNIPKNRKDDDDEDSPDQLNNLTAPNETARQKKIRKQALQNQKSVKKATKKKGKGSKVKKVGGNNSNFQAYRQKFDLKFRINPALKRKSRRGYFPQISSQVQSNHADDSFIVEEQNSRTVMEEYTPSDEDYYAHEFDHRNHSIYGQMQVEDFI